ncbi:unnamed protein product [Rotaria magnacalcarata]
MTASAHINTSTLPPNIFELQHNEFYDFVERHCGHIQAKILQLQHISDVSTFIECGDPTEIFKYHGEKLNELKHLACLITNDGTCIVFPGIIASFKTLKKRFLKKHEDDAKKAKQTKQNFDSSTQLTTSNVNQGKSIDDLRNHLNLTIKQWFINHRVEYNLKNDSDLEENTDYTIEFRNTSNCNQSAIIVCQCGTKSTLSRVAHTGYFQVIRGNSGLQSSGVQWSPMESSGVQWSPMESSGVQWSPMESSGVQWSPVESSGV